jgi:prefoldin subunit 5
MNGVAQEVRREIDSGDKEFGRAIKQLDTAVQEIQERLDAIKASVVRLADRITGLEKEVMSHRWW